MRVFADTFYWIALTDSADEFHVRAREVKRDIVTTDEVLTEYLTFFCAAPEFIRREVRQSALLGASFVAACRGSAGSPSRAPSVGRIPPTSNFSSGS